MRREEHPTHGNRFIGNRNNMEVHDLDNEKTAPNECQIDKIIRAGHVVIFYPDSLEQAHREGFDNCKYCIEDSRGS